uniref:Synaptic vesicular amine transporter n=1 Tax=Sipha flava TaxID=143950 RepID=A0A2S2R6A8_9HEMI
MSFLSQSMESDLGVIVVVYLSLFLDNVLLTVVVPIIPEHLYLQWITNTSSIVNNATREDQSFLQRSLMKIKLQTLENENETIGILLSSKAIVQLFMNPLVGILTSYIGYNLPIFLGSVLLILISVLFAYGETFSTLLIARSLQGTASALISVSGMCLIANQKHMSDLKRSKVMGLVMGSIALGVLIGYPFGGVLYDFVDKSLPFNVIICAISFNLGLQLYTFNFNLEEQVKNFYKYYFKTKLN